MIIAIFSLLCLPACTRQDVPAAAVQDFTARFKEVSAVRWEKEGNQYEVEFKQKSGEHSATYDQTGKFLELETAIAVKALPLAVRQAVDKGYAGYQLREAATIKRGGTTCYEAEVAKSKKSFDLLFDPNGRLLKQTPLNPTDPEK